MENWQSEFLQFTLYILATVWLVQKGSNESKQEDERGLEDDQEQLIGRYAKADSPRWARLGGWRTTVYSNSLIDRHDQHLLPLLVRALPHRLGPVQRRPTHPQPTKLSPGSPTSTNPNSGTPPSRTGNPSSSPSAPWPHSASTSANAAHPKANPSARHTARPPHPAKADWPPRLLKARRTRCARCRHAEPQNAASRRRGTKSSPHDAHTRGSATPRRRARRNRRRRRRQSSPHPGQSPLAYRAISHPHPQQRP